MGDPFVYTKCVREITPSYKEQLEEYIKDDPKYDPVAKTRDVSEYLKDDEKCWEFYCRCAKEKDSVSIEPFNMNLLFEATPGGRYGRV